MLGAKKPVLPELVEAAPLKVYSLEAYLTASDGPKVLLSEFQHPINSRRLQQMTATLSKTKGAAVTH